MSTIVPHARLRAEIDALVDHIDAVEFGLASPSQSERVDRRDHIVRVIRRYLEPRLANPDGPLVVSVFGPTGSGKSTIVNTLAGRAISRSGVLRPTTRQAVAWVHPRHAEALSAVLGPSGPLEIVADEHPVLRSIAIVDTPDIDSISEEHRVQTSAILEASDVAIAVTTPQRYADAVPWEVLGQLTERDLGLIVVMNRASRRSAGAAADLVALLRDAKVAGVSGSEDIIVVQEQRVRADGRLHGAALRHLARRLEALAADHSGASLRGLAGSTRHAVVVAGELAVEIENQAAEADALRAVVIEAVESQESDIVARLDSGELVHDEVVARWQRLIGVSDLADLVSRGVSRVRALLTPGRIIDAERAATVDAEVRDELVELGIRRAERARTSIEVAWSASTAGSALIDSVVVDAGRVRADLASSVSEWQAEVVALVAETGRGRFRLAKAATVGVNAAATLVLLGVFASSGGLTGAEIGVAAGAAAAQQTVLERLLGSATASRLTKVARGLLADRLVAAVSELTHPYLVVLAAVVEDTDTARVLRDSADRVEIALREYLGER
jgi:energy-coupling factor transporter ATP-binding protein EcfA2